MQQNDEILKIEIPPEPADQKPVEEIPVEEAAPFVPDAEARPKIGEQVVTQVQETGRQVTEAAVSTAQRAWESDARKQTTKRIKEGATAVAGKSAQFVQEKMVKSAEEQARARTAAVRQRVQETDWKHEAQTGAARGLRWLSEKLAHLAQRFTPNEPPPPKDPEDNA